MRPLNYPLPGLMAKPDKACVNCMHHTTVIAQTKDGTERVSSCEHSQSIYGYDPVTGSVQRDVPYCASERGPNGNCGIDGIHWIAR